MQADEILIVLDKYLRQYLNGTHAFAWQTPSRRDLPKIPAGLQAGLCAILSPCPVDRERLAGRAYDLRETRGIGRHNAPCLCSTTNHVHEDRH